MNQVLIQVENKVFELFKHADTSKLLYHSYEHTYSVVNACKEICDAQNITKEDEEVVLIAAHFHDAGYLFQIDNHEDKSAELVNDFLKEINYDADKIEKVKQIIMATKMGAIPNNLLEEIIRDADTSALGSNAYNDRTLLLRKECFLLKNIDPDEQEWTEKEIEFLTYHKYYTKHALLNWNQTKLKNLMLKQAELSKLVEKQGQANKKLKLKEDEFQLKKKRSELPEKGIETMFRTSLKNHMELSAIADNKANMMLSISALVLSIVISSLASKFDTHKELIGPTVFMLLVCLTSIVLATLSTNPKITGGRFTPEDVKNRKANLLFFGNFHKMKLDDYEWGMKEIMKDKEYLYSSLIRDLYSLGVVLARKYRFLRFCYLIFMYGMIVSVVYFGISILNAPTISI